MSDQPVDAAEQPRIAPDQPDPSPPNAAGPDAPAQRVVDQPDGEAPGPNDDGPGEPPARWPTIMAAVETGGAGLDALPLLVEQVNATCRPLASVLRSSALRTILDTYRRENQESGRQQKQLKSEMFWSNFCLLAAGALSGVILAISAGAFEAAAALAGSKATDAANVQAARSWAILILGVVTLGLGAAAAYFAYVAREQNRISRWRTSRSEAEMARLDAFSTIASQTAHAGPDVALYGLAVVVRHLLYDQRNWLDKTVVRHAKSSEVTTRMGAVASAMTFIGGSAAIVASQPGGGIAVWFVLAGVVGAAVSTFAANREALSGDRANAERYGKALQALDAIAGRVDGVASAIDAKQTDALNVFTKAIVDVLSAENKQWLEGAAQANAALGKLDEQLSQLGKG
jgi:hypothetical protein